jgi:hypothetical protein
MNPLRALDQRVLPRLGRGLARIGGGVAGFSRGSASRRGLLYGAAVLSVVAVVVAAVYEGTGPELADDTTGTVVRVGAAEGTQVQAYLDRSRAELGALRSGRTGETYALVVLPTYTGPAVLPGLLAGVQTVRVYARVPLPNVQTEIVSFPVTTLATDVPAGMAHTAQRKERSAQESDRFAAGLTGNDSQERELRAFYRQDAGVSRAEAAAYRRRCACVYGAVVRATPVRLRQLAARPGIRSVDPAPEVARLDRTVFLPLLPEQTAVVTPPPDAGIPAPRGR